MLDPDEMVPAGAHEGYRKGLTELHAGSRGIEKMSSTSMGHFPNLEVLWLNNNRLSKLQGLEHNFRLKHLYLQDNAITTLVNASCCLPKLCHLETLQLANNQLQDLKATLAVLSQLRNLRKLGLHSNPLALEGFYRESVIFAIPTLEHLDASVVTPFERAAAIKLFTAKRIEKKYAFGTIPKIWEKAPLVAIGDPSVGELQLRREIRSSTQRRAVAASEKTAAELRESSRPRFDVTYGKEATGLLSAQGGAPVIDKATFEFVARGRVPHLLIKLGFLSMTAASKKVAAALGEKGQGDASQAKVHVAVTALGVQKAPITSRDVLPSQLDFDEEAAFLRFKEFAFEPSVYADAYDRVNQAMRMGKAEELVVTCMLRETSTNQTIGIARLPLLGILQEHVEKTYAYDKVPLMPPRRSGLALPADTPVGYLDVELVSDWGLSNTSAGDYGNSASEFVRRRKEADKSKSSTSIYPVSDGGGKPTRLLARDRVYLSATASATPPKEPSYAAPAPAGAPAGAPAVGIVFDAARYAEYEKAKAALKPKERVVQPIAL